VQGEHPPFCSSPLPVRGRSIRPHETLLGAHRRRRSRPRRICLDGLQQRGLEKRARAERAGSARAGHEAARMLSQGVEREALRHRHRPRPAQQGGAGERRHPAERHRARLHPRQRARHRIPPGEGGGRRGRAGLRRGAGEVSGGEGRVPRLRLLRARRAGGRGSPRWRRRSPTRTRRARTSTWARSIA